MPMRLSGLMSGMDTESVIQQLVEARKVKVTTAVKAQKSLKYKQDAWKSLNSDILKLYNKSLSNMRFESSFIKKTTKVSNSNVVSVITGEGAMNSVQNLKVDTLARSGYLTGGKMELAQGAESDKITSDTKLKDLGFTGAGTIRVTTNGEYGTVTVDENSTVGNFVKTLREAGVNANFDEANGRIYVAAKASGEKSDFSLTSSDIGGLQALQALKLDYGKSGLSQDQINDAVNAKMQSQLDQFTAQRNDSFTKIDNILKANADKLAAAGWQNMDDFDYRVLRTSSPDAQETFHQLMEETFKDDPDVLAEWQSTVSALDEAEANLAIDSSGNVTGLSADAEQKIRDEVSAVANASGSAQKTDGQDAVIYLNDVMYTSSSNTFSINSLTLTVNAKTAPGEEVTISTQDDTDGIYDMIRNFFKEYNTLINQMDKLYNAESAKGYDPLTDEEKEAMSDSAIEEWENKIKDSILRKDETLGTFSTAMKTIMMEGVEVNGKKMYLSNFGINTLNYFTAAENEKNAYHIDGDPDDSDTMGNPDVLKSMIANDPDTVVSFFTQLSKNLYNKMFDLMKGTEYSSAMTAYEDKKMKTEYDEYTTKIKDLEKKLADYEDKWYAKFAAMETALAKMQNNASAVTALLGG